MKNENYKEPGKLYEIEANELMFMLRTGITPKLQSDRRNITGDVEEIKTDKDHKPVCRYKKPTTRYKKEGNNDKT
tara:strand:- start:452 stop:676 length:225 start_codon:yes stop_codon:yes gene_type:complete